MVLLKIIDIIFIFLKVNNHNIEIHLDGKFPINHSKKQPSQSIPAQSIAPLSETEKDLDILGSNAYFGQISDIIMLCSPYMVTAATIILRTIFIKFAY